MNNLNSIDYQNYDMSTETDGVLARWSQEFPRLSPLYQTKDDADHAPWGTKSTPVRFDAWEEAPLAASHSCKGETTLGGQTFEKGVWYYTGIPMTDHHDIAGIENMFRPVETAAGTEWRPQLYINMLNRLRLLEIEDRQGPSDVKMIDTVN